MTSFLIIWHGRRTREPSFKIAAATCLHVHSHSHHDFPPQLRRSRAHTCASAFRAESIILGRKTVSSMVYAIVWIHLSLRFLELRV